MFGIFKLLKLYFTPITLYCGDSSAPGAGPGATEGTGIDNSGSNGYNSTDNEYGTSEAEFDEASAENDANESGSNYGGNEYGGGSNNFDSFESAYAYHQQQAQEYGAQIELSNPFEGLFDSLFSRDTLQTTDAGYLDVNAFSGINSVMNTPIDTIQSISQMFSPKSLSYTDTQPAPYTANAGASATYEMTANMFGMISHTTTLTTPNMNGGMNVSISEEDFFGGTLDNYTTNMDGSVTSHTTQVSIGNSLSFSYDTHYWQDTNQQFGFAAEIVADTLEILGAKTQVARDAAAVTEVAMMLINVFIPSAQLVAAGIRGYSINKAYSMISMAVGFLSMYEALSTINGIGTEINPGGSLESSMIGITESGGDRYGLGEQVLDEYYNDEFIPFLIGSSSLRASGAMMPQLNKPTSFINPTNNKEENMQSQQAVFIDYRGGLSEVLAPNLIGANEGSVYANISIDKGTLSSRQLGTIGTNKLGAYYSYLPNEKIFYSDYAFSMVELGNFMYMTTENPILNGVYQLDYNTLDADCTDTDLVQVKLDEPSTDPDVNAVGTTELEEELWEEYTYAYTFYDRESGFESIPKFSTTFLKKTDSLNITSLSYSTDANTDVIRLYRLGGYSTSYRLVAEIDNTATSGTTNYTDTCTEEYNPTLLDTQDLTIIENLIGLVEHKGSFFAYKENRVYFSRPGKPNAWNEFNSIRVGGTVSGLVSTPLGVIICTSNSQTYLLGGTDKYNFTLSTLAKSIGSTSYKSMSNLKNTAIWLDYEGLMMSVGSTVSNISKEKVDLTDIGEINSSLVYDSVYYLIGANYTLAVDFRYNTPSFSKIVGIDFMSYHKGKIYIDIDGVHYEDAFRAGDLMELHYRAPMFIGNSYDILTEFNKINLTYKGDFEYKIYIDEVEIASGNVSSSNVKVEEIKLPSNNNEGLGLEFELIGAGEVKAFRYIFNNVNIN